MPYRVGFIGTGEIARIHAKVLAESSEKWRILCGYDVAKQACEAFCADFGATALSSAGDILSSPEVDVVYICTRHDSHVQLASDACRAGKKVFLEKPLAMDAAGALVLKKTHRLHSVPFVVGFNMRVAPATMRFRQLLSQHGAIPESFRMNMTGAPYMNSWASDPVSGGGTLIAQAPHMFDMLANLLGSRVAEVIASTRRLSHPEELMPNSAALLLRLENGVEGTLLLHDRGTYPFHVNPGGKMINLTVYSPQGTFELDAYSGVRYVQDGKLIEETPDTSYEIAGRWGYRAQAAFFAEYLDTGTGPLCTLDEAAGVVAVVDAAFRSEKSGRWDTVDYSLLQD